MTPHRLADRLPGLAREGTTEFDCRGRDGNGSQPVGIANGHPGTGAEHVPYQHRAPGWQLRVQRAGLDLAQIEAEDKARAPKLGRPRKEGSADE